MAKLYKHVYVNTSKSGMENGLMGTEEVILDISGELGIAPDSFLLVDGCLVFKTSDRNGNMTDVIYAPGTWITVTSEIVER
jgi:hypothetical protein